MCDQQTLAGAGLAALSAGRTLDAAITFENSSRARSGLPESAEATARPYVARRSSGRAARTRSKDAEAAARGGGWAAVAAELRRRVVCSEMAVVGGGRAAVGMAREIVGGDAIEVI